MSGFRNDHYRPDLGIRVPNPTPAPTVPTLVQNPDKLPSSTEPSDGGAAGAETIGGSRQRTELNKLLDGFAPSELAIVLFIAKRLELGRKEYGVMNPLDGHDWMKEMAEESADGLVYLATAKLYASAMGFAA